MGTQTSMIAASREIAELRTIIAQLTEHGEFLTTPISGLSMFRKEEPTEPTTGMYEPSICMVVQGSKQVILG